CFTQVRLNRPGARCAGDCIAVHTRLLGHFLEAQAQDFAVALRRKRGSSFCRLSQRVQKILERGQPLGTALDIPVRCRFDRSARTVHLWRIEIQAPSTVVVPARLRSWAKSPWATDFVAHFLL